MKKLLVPAVICAAIGFAGCLDSGVENTPRAAIMVNLFSPKANNTNIYLNGTAIGTNVSYGNIAAGYNQVTAGSVTVQVTNANGTANLLNANATLQSGNYYSAFVVDTAANTKLITVRDSVSFPGSQDTEKVRFYNFAVGTPTVNVFVKGDATSTWNGYGFETQTSADMRNSFKALKAGKLVFEIKNAANTDVLKTDSITLTGGHVYTMYLKGVYTDTAAATRYSLGAISHG